MDLRLVTRAAAYAAEAHTGQLRKGSPEPYINHPLRVAQACAEIGLSAEAIAAALLHDVVEDTSRTQAEVAAAFPARVAHLADLLTKWWPDDAPADIKAKGKPTYYGGILSDPEAIAVKLLDRTDNLLSMVAMLPKMRGWAVNYQRKTSAEVTPLAEACRHPAACERYFGAVAALEAALAATAPPAE